MPLAYLALTILCQPPHHAANNGGGSAWLLVHLQAACSEPNVQGPMIDGLLMQVEGV